MVMALEDGVNQAVKKPCAAYTDCLLQSSLKQILVDFSVCGCMLLRAFRGEPLALPLAWDLVTGI